MSDFPEVENYKGDDVIVTDGHTLLGADDKAGVAEIITAIEYLQAHPEIEVVIPAGTTIQSLRMSAINNQPHDLTRDGYHMGFGAGRYALACTWYEELIAPYTKVSMAGNTLRINKGMVAVTPITAAYCQKAAQKAVRRNFTPKRIKQVKTILRKIEHNN